MGSIFRASNNSNGRGFPEEVTVADFDIIIRQSSTLSPPEPRKCKEKWRAPQVGMRPKRATWSDDEVVYAFFSSNTKRSRSSLIIIMQTHGKALVKFSLRTVVPCWHHQFLLTSMGATILQRPPVFSLPVSFSYPRFRNYLGRGRSLTDCHRGFR